MKYVWSSFICALVLVNYTNSFPSFPYMGVCLQRVDDATRPL
jgi:hypothetical protein